MNALLQDGLTYGQGLDLGALQWIMYWLLVPAFFQLLNCVYQSTVIYQTSGITAAVQIDTQTR